MRNTLIPFTWVYPVIRLITWFYVLAKLNSRYPKTAILAIIVCWSSLSIALETVEVTDYPPAKNQLLQITASGKSLRGILMLVVDRDQGMYKAMYNSYTQYPDPYLKITSNYQPTFQPWFTYAGYFESDWCYFYGKMPGLTSESGEPPIRGFIPVTQAVAALPYNENGKPNQQLQSIPFGDTFGKNSDTGATNINQVLPAGYGKPFYYCNLSLNESQSAGTWTGGIDSHPGYGVNAEATQYRLWSGNFLNWATMTKMDIVRKMLYGGKRYETSTNEHAGETLYGTVLQRQYQTHAFGTFGFSQFYRSFKVGNDLSGGDIPYLTPYPRVKDGEGAFPFDSDTATFTYGSEKRAGITICNGGPENNSNSPRFFLREFVNFEGMVIGDCEKASNQGNGRDIYDAAQAHNDRVYTNQFSMLILACPNRQELLTYFAKQGLPYTDTSLYPSPTRSAEKEPICGSQYTHYLKPSSPISTDIPTTMPSGLLQEIADTDLAEVGLVVGTGFIKGRVAAPAQSFRREVKRDGSFADSGRSTAMFKRTLGTGAPQPPKSPSIIRTLNNYAVARDRGAPYVSIDEENYITALLADYKIGYHDGPDYGLDLVTADEKSLNKTRSELFNIQSRPCVSGGLNQRYSGGGNCSNWGSPLGLMYVQALRYLYQGGSYVANSFGGGTDVLESALLSPFYYYSDEKYIRYVEQPTTIDWDTFDMDSYDFADKANIEPMQVRSDIHKDYWGFPECRKLTVAVFGQHETTGDAPSSEIPSYGGRTAFESIFDSTSLLEVPEDQKDFFAATDSLWNEIRNKSTMAYVGSSRLPATTIDGIEQGDFICTPKTITRFSQAHGICPKSGAGYGSYMMSGAAWLARLARLNVINPSTRLLPEGFTKGPFEFSKFLLSDNSFRTDFYGVQTSPSTPTITINAPRSFPNKRQVLIFPLHMTGNPATKRIYDDTVLGAAYLTHLKQAPNQSRLYSTGQMVDALLSEYDAGESSGTMIVNFDDATFGNDYDWDAKCTYSWRYNSSGNLEIRVKMETGPGDDTAQACGYYIYGTASDGLQLHQGFNGSGYMVADAQKPLRKWLDWTDPPPPYISAGGGKIDHPLNDGLVRQLTDAEVSTLQTKHPLWSAQEIRDRYFGYDRKGQPQSPIQVLGENGSLLSYSKLRYRYCLTSDSSHNASSAPYSYSDGCNEGAPSLAQREGLMYFHRFPVIAEYAVPDKSTSSSDPVILESPLYYAAQFGGFRDGNALDPAEVSRGKSTTAPETYSVVNDPIGVAARLRNTLLKTLSQPVNSKFAKTTFDNNVSQKVVGVESDFGYSSSDLKIYTYQSASSSGAYNKQTVSNTLSVSNRLKQIEGQQSSAIHMSRKFPAFYNRVRDSGKKAFSTEALHTTEITAPITGGFTNDPDVIQAFLPSAVQTVAIPAVNLQTLPAGQRQNYLLRRSHALLGGFKRLNESPTNDYNLRLFAATEDGPRLGAIWNSAPTIVTRDSRASRDYDSVYVGTQSGVVWGFKLDTGDPLFAYLPSKLLGQAGRYVNQGFNADIAGSDGGPYASFYQNEKGEHKVLLVGTLGRGGKGAYALDITSISTFSTIPNLFKWEFSDVDDTRIGFITTSASSTLQQQGNNLVQKFADGKIRVALPNGVDWPAQPRLIATDTGELVKRKPVLFLLDAQGPGSAGNWGPQSTCTVDFYAMDATTAKASSKTSTPYQTGSSSCSYLAVEFPDVPSSLEPSDLTASERSPNGLLTATHWKSSDSLKGSDLIYATDAWGRVYRLRVPEAKAWTLELFFMAHKQISSVDTFEETSLDTKVQVYQPISAIPRLVEFMVDGRKQLMVILATGKNLSGQDFFFHKYSKLLKNGSYLIAGDATEYMRVESVYGILDTTALTADADISFEVSKRNRSSMTERSFATGFYTPPGEAIPQDVDYITGDAFKYDNTNYGWYLDFTRHEHEFVNNEIPIFYSGNTEDTYIILDSTYPIPDSEATKNVGTASSCTGTATPPGVSRYILTAYGGEPPSSNMVDVDGDGLFGQPADVIVKKGDGADGQPCTATTCAVAPVIQDWSGIGDRTNLSYSGSKLISGVQGSNTFSQIVLRSTSSSAGTGGGGTQLWSWRELVGVVTQ